MAWMKVDDGFHDHPKVDDLPLEAVGLWLLCGTYCARHLTDGFVNTRRVQKMGGTDELVRALLETGLWDEVEGGYQFHDWGEYQPTKAKTEAEREASRERQRKYRRNSQGEYVGSNGVSNAVTDGVTNAVSNTTPSRPVPSRPKPSPASQTTPDGFTEFWAAYPKKEAKKAALRIYERTIKDTSPEDIINGAKRYAEHVKAEKKERKFIKSPDGWLNAGRWEDDITTSTHAPSKNPLWDT